LTNDPPYQLTVNLSTRRPLLLAIDGAHRLDGATLRWLMYLSARLRCRGVVLAAQALTAAAVSCSLAPAAAATRKDQGASPMRRQWGHESLLDMTRPKRSRVELIVRIAPHSDPVAGELTDGLNPRRSFHGWIELIAALEAARTADLLNPVVNSSDREGYTS
jgi:hypothetical protein